MIPITSTLWLTLIRVGERILVRRQHVRQFEQHVPQRLESTDHRAAVGPLWLLFATDEGELLHTSTSLVKTYLLNFCCGFSRSSLKRPSGNGDFGAFRHSAYIRTKDRQHYVPGDSTRYSPT
jgi:hypothetical protein